MVEYDLLFAGTEGWDPWAAGFPQSPVTFLVQTPGHTGSEHTLPHLEHKPRICFCTCENESVYVCCAKRHWEASKLKMKGKIQKPKLAFINEG